MIGLDPLASLTVGRVFRGKARMQSSDHHNNPFRLRTHLRGMRPEDALEVVLPAEYTGLRIGELLEVIFPGDEEGRSHVEEMFDLRENPDLPEIYGVLLDVLSGWRLGDYRLKISATDDTVLELSDRTAGLLRPSEPCSSGHPSYPVLDLVMEREFPSLDHAVQKGYWEDKATLIQWLRSLTLLYFLDKHEFKLSPDPSTDTDRRLLALAEDLVEDRIILPSEETGCFRITENGRRFLGSQIAETESYIDRYDLFKDVAYEEEGGTVEFGSGPGEDMRVQIYIDEGLDPVRTVFLLRLYDGSLDEFTGNWQERIHDESFYNEVLEPVMDHHRVENGLIGQIIESGFAHLEEEMAEERESRSNLQILEKVRGTPGLRLDGEEQDKG